MEWVGYLAIGSGAGLLAGLLGVGGGLVIVPVLLWLFRGQGFDEAVVLHLAIGTSLGTIVATSLSSIRAHQRRGAIQWPLVLRLTPGILAGAWVGAWIADQIQTLWLQRLFAGFVFFVGLQMLLNPKVGGHRPPLNRRCSAWQTNPDFRACRGPAPVQPGFFSRQCC